MTDERPYLLTIPSIFFIIKRGMFNRKVVLSDPNWAAWTFRLQERAKLGLLRLGNHPNWAGLLDRFRINYTFYEEVNNLDTYLYDNYAKLKVPIFVILPWDLLNQCNIRTVVLHNYEPQNTSDFKRVVDDALSGK